MHIGYAATSITPTLDRPVYLAGFANNRRATSINDDLWVRALALHDEHCTLVLVAVDVIGIFHNHVHDIQTAVQQAANHPTPLHIIISASHTHHGPDTMGLWGPDEKTSGVDPTYLHTLKAQIVACILAAVRTRHAAHSKTAMVQVAGWVKNTRDPAIIDDTLTLLQCVAPDGTVLATLCNYPCHPEVLWNGNQAITADYVHYMREALHLQSGAPVLFMPGALGGMLTPDAPAQSFADARQMGEALAQAAYTTLNACTADSATIAVVTRPITAKLTNPLYKLAFWYKVLPDLRDRRGHIHTEVSLLKIGGLWLATVPGELFPKLGFQLKAAMHAAGATHTGVIGLANDELGYILPLEDFSYPWNPFNPGAHYEETNSIGKAITTAVMQTLQQMIAGRV
ncbi:MAG: hypothetical protein ACKO83_08575 [Roseiflexaceae bacterium]